MTDEKSIAVEDIPWLVQSLSMTERNRPRSTEISVRASRKCEVFDIVVEDRVHSSSLPGSVHAPQRGRPLGVLKDTLAAVRQAELMRGILLSNMLETPHAGIASTTYLDELSL